jgi:hypothetical protein
MKQLAVEQHVRNMNKLLREQVYVVRILQVKEITLEVD